MARSRNIKPGFFLNDDLAECDPLARLLFAGLWCIADREGRLEDRPKRIKAEVLPYDNCDVDQLMNQLVKHKFILRYEVDGGQYIQIINFKKHQNPHVKEAPSIIPPPPEQDIAPNEHHTSTVQEPEQNNSFPADSLNLIPDSLINISTSEQSPDTQLEDKDSELKKPKKPRQIPLFDKTTEQYKLAMFMRQCILNNLPKAKVPKPTPEGLRRWAYDIDLMMRVDCRSPDEIRELIDWSHRDPFWKANILSPGKLREKWDTLVAHKQRAEEKNKASPGKKKTGTGSGKYDDIYL
jgi:hypothetical protein